LNALHPDGITELQRGIEVRFPDGHRANLSFDGHHCTCRQRQPGLFCPHIVAALPAYKGFKWRRIEGDDNFQNPGFLGTVGIDPAIFNPPAVDWSRFDADTELVRRRLWRKQHGWLFQFRDGAFFAFIDEHPQGMTKCSLCHSRECRHVEAARAELRQVEEQVACGTL
jgi:hypothetical protein